MQIKKKTVAVAVVAAFGSLAVGGAAWAWISAQGSGSASATATATAGTVTLTGSASITDLDTPAVVTIDGESDQPNRHISSVTITINPKAVLPKTCELSWFGLRQGKSDPFTSSITVPVAHTFLVAGDPDTDIVPNVFVQLSNEDADQTACVKNASLTNLLSLTAA